MAQPEPTDAEINAGTEPEPEPSPTPAQPRTKGSSPKRAKVRSVKLPSKTILLAMLVVIVVSVLGDMKRNNSRTPKPRILLGGFAVTIILLIASEFLDEIPEGFAVLMMVATLIGPNGEAVWDTVKKLATTDSTPKPGGNTATAPTAI